MSGTAVVAAGSPTHLALAESEIAARIAPVARWTTPERLQSLVQALVVARAYPDALRARFARLHEVFGED